MALSREETSALLASLIWHLRERQEITMGSDLVFYWRKASRSGQTGQCVELGVAWRKSSFSGGTGQCVEVAAGAVRDSKNAAGPTLRVDVRSLVTFAQSGRLAR